MIVLKVWAIVNMLAIAMRLAYEIAKDCGGGSFKEFFRDEKFYLDEDSDMTEGDEDDGV